ncbi:hypothetical protein EVB32_057 [Rhizobium phage RHph_TM39]|uniref:Uncharacterized protein n=1 Tax=Rhizobium phage RHph_TM30 TaxID=2509764 RepID=A0A7S5REK9_9CAUD|nr:hypothetical protein PQC16_gp057 [Rhizobium phage RHph_TM30]QIG71164.1 hypothetical protein EVB93_057 [Rhizobium phage RHph_TM30]QIG77045.1 hypothetical protein EVB32_057 [Rhizobium phage RHph_TM39]QIG77384.1 hypothetical protein EVB61_056 [Rhizobium phage RHph_TM21B]QIG77644.1 hypothetical protein EVB64_057 [Rhizobium phage RHph_TM61]
MNRLVIILAISGAIATANFTRARGSSLETDAYAWEICQMMQSTYNEFVGEADNNVTDEKIMSRIQIKLDKDYVYPGIFYNATVVTERLDNNHKEFVVLAKLNEGPAWIEIRASDPECYEFPR